MPASKPGGALKYRPLTAFALSDRLLLATTRRSGVLRWSSLRETGALSTLPSTRRDLVDVETSHTSEEETRSRRRPTERTNEPRPQETLARNLRPRLASKKNPWKRKLVHHVPVDAISSLEPSGPNMISLAAFGDELKLSLRADSTEERDSWLELLRTLAEKHKAAPNPRKDSTTLVGSPSTLGARKQYLRNAKAKTPRSRSWAPSLSLKGTTTLDKINSFVASATKRKDSI